MGVFRPLSQTKFINDANLVSYWKLDGNSLDSKGSNNGTDTNMSYSAGQFDNCGVFNGTSSYITISNPTNFNFASNFTISGWLYITGSSGNRTILSKTASSSWTTSGKQIFINNTTNYLQIDNFGVGSLASTIAIPTSSWTHFTITRNGNVMTIYINGVYNNTATYTYSADNSSHLLRSGILATDAYFNGSIDDMAFFSRALSAGEVAELYQSMTLGEYLPNSSTKLLLHLNGSSADSSGNSNNGTNTNITFSQANGKFGQGAGYGGNSYITTPTGSLTTTSSFTISFLFKFTAVNTGNNRDSGKLAGLVGKYNGDNGGWNFGIPNLYLDTTTATYAIKISNRDSSGVLVSGDIMNVNMNQLYLITYVYNTSIGTYGTNYVYIDGVLKFTGANSRNNTNFSNPVYWGRADDLYNNTTFINGMTDEHIIENRAWSAEEIKKYSTYTKGRFGIV